MQDDWRIKMPVAEALFLRVEPIIDVRVITKTNGENYPPHIPPHITKLFEVHAVSAFLFTELENLATTLKPNPKLNYQKCTFVF